MPDALPARFYTDPALPSREDSAIFRRGWHLLGHESQLAGTGDRLVDRIGNLPAVVVRDERGGLRGFHNVCRHRAAPVATWSGAGGKALVCAYHGWSYRLDGTLKRAPGMPESRDFDPAEVELPALELAGWKGLVFAADQPAMPFTELVAGIAERTGERGLAGFRHSRRVEYDIECNWKVYVDNFLEGYHLPRVHPALNRMLDYRSYRTETGDWNSLQWSPLEGGDGPWGAGEAQYWFLWPATMLNILPDRLQTNRIHPVAVDRCRVVFDYFHPEGTDPERAAADERISDEIQREDIAICEAVQRGMASRSWETGPLNPQHETGVHHFQSLYRSAMGL